MLMTLCAGYSPDGALVSLQGREARSSRRTCFCIHPALMKGGDDSDTCRATTWANALKTASAPKKRCYNASELLASSVWCFFCCDLLRKTAAQCDFVRGAAFREPCDHCTSVMETHCTSAHMRVHAWSVFPVSSHALPF